MPRKRRGQRWTRRKRGGRGGGPKIDPIDKRIRELYYTPSQPASFTSRNKIYKALKDLRPNEKTIKLKKISEWLAKDDIP